MPFAEIGPIAVHFPERCETNDQLQAEFPEWDLAVQLFDQAFYLEDNADVAAAIAAGRFASAAEHFWQVGQAEGRDLAWQRVFDYPEEAHVKFNHAPHIRASVECATCHGDIAHQTVAQRNVDHNMGFCVNCHNENKASVDCLTCHF